MNTPPFVMRIGIALVVSLAATTAIAKQKQGVPESATAARAERSREKHGYAAAWRGYHTQDRHVGLGACSLIAPSWVITAAHVASKKAHTPERTNVKIRFRGEMCAVDRAFCANGGDLAIAHLSRPVTNVTPLAICAERILKGCGDFPMTWVSAGRVFRVVQGIECGGRKNGDRIYVGKSERPGKAGDSGCAFVLDMPSPQRDILIGVLHGSGRAQQPAVFRKWIDETIAAHSDEKAKWVEPPSNKYLRARAKVLTSETDNAAKPKAKSAERSQP